MYVHTVCGGTECSGHGENKVNHQYCSLSCTIKADIHRHGWHLLLLRWGSAAAVALCLLKPWSMKSLFTSMAVSLWTYSKYNCTEHVWACPSMCLVLVWVITARVYSVYVCTSSPSGQLFSVISSLLIWCGLSAGDLVESLWCLMPNTLLAPLTSRPHSHCWLLTSQVCFVSSIRGVGKTLQHMSRARDSPTAGCKSFPILLKVVWLTRCRLWA